jgi:hypothetical protein
MSIHHMPMCAVSQCCASRRACMAARALAPFINGGLPCAANTTACVSCVFHLCCLYVLWVSMTFSAVDCSFVSTSISLYPELCVACVSVPLLGFSFKEASCWGFWGWMLL